MELNLITGLMAVAVYFGGCSVYRKIRYFYLIKQRARRSRHFVKLKMRPGKGVRVINYYNLNPDEL